MAVHIHELNTAQTIFMKYVFERVRPGEGEHVRFVQVGANVGSNSGDPIHALVAAGRWRGLLIEPIPHVFQELASNYAGVEGLSFENSAISKTQAEQQLYFPADRTALASFSEAVVREHVGGNAPLESIKVKCRPLDDVLQEHGIADFDVLVVDTEGHDRIVIETLDFERSDPAVIFYESKHLSDEDKSALFGDLSARGYVVIEMGSDTLAIRPHEDEREFFKMMQGVFLQFRTMERRSMLVMTSIHNLAVKVVENTPRA